MAVPREVLEITKGSASGSAGRSQGERRHAWSYRILRGRLSRMRPGRTWRVWHGYVNSRFLRHMRKRPKIAHLYVATILILAVWFTVRKCPSASLLNSTLFVSDKSLEDLRAATLVSLTAPLLPPPRIRAPLQHDGQNGNEQSVPTDHAKPHVFTAVGVPGQDPVTKMPLILLFLYSQGTVSWDAVEKLGFFLNVTSCLVGSDRFPISHKASGVYTCAVSRELERGERLTLTVSASPWDIHPSIERKQLIIKYLEGLEQLDDGSFVLGSGVTWDGQMETGIAKNEGRYNICMMTQEKTFPEYIPEWIAYHRRIGVDHVYIYDNGAAGNLSKVYENATDVEIVQWPWQRSQLQAQNHFLLTGRTRCQWGLLIDVDEFLMVKPQRMNAEELELKRHLRLARESYDFSQIRVTSVSLGSSGNVYRPRAPLAESYWHYANLQDELTKPLVWLGHTLPDSNVHHVTMAAGYYTETTASALTFPERSEIALCHMKYRSWEDYVLKSRGGRNSILVEAWSYSSNWSIHTPRENHMSVRNAGTWVEFRKRWRRVMLHNVHPPDLRPANDHELRYNRVSRKGYVWKRRRSLGNSTMELAIVEREKCFRKLKDWEIAKRDRLVRLNLTVEF